MIFRRIRQKQANINAGSMADIGFLLLIFFIVTSSMTTKKGLKITLPNKENQNIINKPIQENNIIKIAISNLNEISVNQKVYAINQFPKALFNTYINSNKSADNPNSPQEAVFMLKVDKDASYQTYLKVLDCINITYYKFIASQYPSVNLKQLETIRLPDSVSSKYPLTVIEHESL